MTVLDDELLRVPVLSTLQLVPDPSAVLNSWAAYSVLRPETDPDQVTVTVELPVEVTLPYQISSSAFR